MKFPPFLFFSTMLAVVLMTSGCASLKDKLAAASKETSPEASGGPAASTLLGMSFGEASSMASQHIEVAQLPRVAADSIEVLRRSADGKPKKVRAKGRVFVEMEGDHAHALCDEALISGDEVILRGKPMLQRGTSTVEGMSDVTVFYLFGTSLRVIGRHRLTNSSQLASESPWQNTGSTSGSVSLLPPLESSDVPESVREEMRKAAEAEAQLQRSRAGLPPAFPEALAPGAAMPVADAGKPQS